MNFFIQIKNNIPNTITSLNLLSGIFSIVATFEGYPVWAGALILLAAFFDFIDGFSARLLNARSEIGKQLDSLADLVSFGLAPAVIVYSFFKTVLLIANLEADDMIFSNLLILSIPFLITLFSAIRLAKFTIDSRQETEFIGLPTPANAIFFACLPIILSQYDLKAFFVILNLKALIIVVLIHSFLLVSPLPLFSLKIKSLSWKSNEYRYIFLIITIMMIIWLKYYAIPLIIWLYVLFGIVRYFVAKFRR